MKRQNRCQIFTRSVYTKIAHPEAVTRGDIPVKICGHGNPAVNSGHAEENEKHTSDSCSEKQDLQNFPHVNPPAGCNKRRFPQDFISPGHPPGDKSEYSKNTDIKKVVPVIVRAEHFQHEQHKRDAEQLSFNRIDVIAFIDDQNDNLDEETKPERGLRRPGQTLSHRSDFIFHSTPAGLLRKDMPYNFLTCVSVHIYEGLYHICSRRWPHPLLNLLYFEGKIKERSNAPLCGGKNRGHNK